MNRALLFLLAAVFAVAMARPAQAAWGSDPYVGSVQVSTDAGSEILPNLASDGASGTFVAWCTYGGMVRVQHLDANGEPLWAVNGIALGGTSAYATPRVVLDGVGGVIVLWEDARFARGDVIFAQRVDATGTPLWTAGGVQLNSTPGGSSLVRLLRQRLRAVSDGQSGAIFCYDQRTLSSGTIEGPLTAYVQRVSSAGLALWGTNGLRLNAAGPSSEAPVLTVDGAGGAVVAWGDGRNGGDIFAQRFNGSGIAQWATNGITVTAASGVHYSPAIVTDGVGGAIVAWRDFGSPTEGLWAQRLNGNGARQWAGNVTIRTGGFLSYSADSDGAGNLLVAWSYVAGSIPVIAAARLSNAGSSLWTSDVFVGPPGLQTNEHAIASDGAGGAHVAWVDGRTGAGPDVYARHVQSSGVASLPISGSLVCGAGDTQLHVAVAGSTSGTAVVAWTDLRAGSGDIHAQRVDTWGSIGDARPRILAVRDTPDDQGGQVKLVWSASVAEMENWPDPFEYRVSRRNATLGWDLLAIIEGAMLDAYSVVVPTSADSGATNPFTVLRVEARSLPVGTPNWFAEPDSGYSVDNIAPSIPTGVMAVVHGTRTRLTWAANTDRDLAGYRVYRAARSGADLAGAVLVASPLVPTFESDEPAPLGYRITAVDRHGNPSAPAAWTPAPGSPAAQPGSTRFAGASPNPFGASSTFAFELSREADVTLELFDVAGHRVRTLIRQRYAPGAHRMAWDAAGGLTPGVYLARFVADGVVSTQRVVRLR